MYILRIVSSIYNPVSNYINKFMSLERIRSLLETIYTIIHFNIFRFVNELNSLYGMPTLAVFLVSCLIICLLTFQFSANKVVIYFFYKLNYILKYIFRILIYRWLSRYSFMYRHHFSKWACFVLMDNV